MENLAAKPIALTAPTANLHPSMFPQATLFSEMYSTDIRMINLNLLREMQSCLFVTLNQAKNDQC